MNFFRFSLLSLFLSSISLAYAEEDMHLLLNKMNQTLEMSNYEGTFVFMHKGSVETMRIIHGYSSKGVKEKLVSLTGDAREVIRDKDVLTCIWPRDKIVVIETAKAQHGIPSSLPEDYSELTLNYQLTEVGNARVAGYDCTIVRFQPLDDFRYGHELCINPVHGMLLKSKTFDSNNEAIENMMFTSFRTRESTPDALFEPSVELKDYTWKTAKVELNGELQPDRAWKIKDLPPGFSIRSVSRRLMSASKKPVQHMVLTDGLASVSVFISKVEKPKQIYQGAHTKGVINAYARDLNEHQITVVGEVPEGTVKMIGTSIFYSGQ